MLGQLKSASVVAAVQHGVQWRLFQIPDSLFGPGFGDVWIEINRLPHPSALNEHGRACWKVSNIFMTLLPYIFWPLLGSSTCELGATWPLPSSQGCRPHYIDVDAGVWLCMGLGVGRKQEGRPMVWETREVCSVRLLSPTSLAAH